MVISIILGLCPGTCRDVVSSKLVKCLLKKENPTTIPIFARPPFWPLRLGGNGLLRIHVRVAAVQVDHVACLLVEAGGGALQACLEAVKA